MNSTGYITPAAAALAQTGQVERVAPRDVRVARTRRAAGANAVEPADELVLSVETADAVTEYRPHDEEHEEHKRQDRRRGAPQPKKEVPLREELAAEFLRRRGTSAQRRVGPGGLGTAAPVPAGYCHPSAPTQSGLDITG